MDRFEVFPDKYYFVRIKTIYIPVWIDLKDWNWILSVNSKSLYIPVWIDLKCVGFSPFQMILNPLHSSMDRFEVDVNTERLEGNGAFTFQYG